MWNIKKMNIKNHTYYFLNGMIGIKGFDSSLLKREKSFYKIIDIYYIGYITIKKVDDYENIYGVNQLHLTIDEVNGFTEEKNENKSLAFGYIDDENKEVLTKYAEFWNEICPL